MPACRIYLVTYRRNDLLPRALMSLLGQTFQDWVCELHNDDPGDPFPKQLVEQTADPRITVVNHPVNLGPTRTFNLIFNHVAEPYVSLLEDDNWWEPAFLEEMIATMNAHPSADVAWSNMRVWREGEAEWTTDGETVWTHPEGEDVEFFHWPHRRQIMSALHSNGAMLIRSSNASKFVIPEETPFSAVEPVRERSFSYPMIFLPRVLANFAVTKKTARSGKAHEWGQVQTLLVASFFKHVSVKGEALRNIWEEAGRGPAKTIGSLFVAGLICKECRYLLRYAGVKDWLFFTASSLRHPVNLIRILRAKTYYKELWRFLDGQTSLRNEEAYQRELAGA